MNVLNAVILQWVGWQCAVDNSERCIPGNTQLILRNGAYQVCRLHFRDHKAHVMLVSEQGADNYWATWGWALCDVNAAHRNRWAVGSRAPLWCGFISSFQESHLFPALWLSCTGRCLSALCSCASLPPHQEIGRFPANQGTGSLWLKQALLLALETRSRGRVAETHCIVHQPLGNGQTVQCGLILWQQVIPGWNCWLLCYWEPGCAAVELHPVPVWRCIILSEELNHNNTW